VGIPVVVVVVVVVVYDIKSKLVLLMIMATGWTIIVLGFHSQWGLGIFLFTTMSGTALWLTQPPIQWVPETLSLGVKWPVHEADH